MSMYVRFMSIYVNLTIKFLASPKQNGDFCRKKKINGFCPSIGCPGMFNAKTWDPVMLKNVENHITSLSLASFGQRNWLVGGLEHEWIIFHFIKKGCHPKPIVPKSSYFSEWLKPWLLHHQPVGVGKCWDVFASNDLGENRNLDQEGWIRRDFTRLSLPWLNRNQTGDTKKHQTPGQVVS